MPRSARPKTNGRNFAKPRAKNTAPVSIRNWWHTKKQNNPVNLFTPFAFEHRSKPVLSQRKFYHRLARCAALGIGVVLFALIIGMIGYHFLEGMKWIDAFTNASMILSGMGPMGELKTSGGKIFAGCYALFSGVTFLSSVGLIFAPIFHRFLHKFHFESAKEAKEK